MPRCPASAYENRFFSGVVGIQTERGHTLVTSGKYSWVRHPGHAGGLLYYLETPFFLNSIWALMHAVLACMVLVLRTALEDGVLQAELAGYARYAMRVRCRLVPGIWYLQQERFVRLAGSTTSTPELPVRSIVSHCARGCSWQAR